MFLCYKNFEQQDYLGAMDHEDHYQDFCTFYSVFQSEESGFESNDLNS